MIRNIWAVGRNYQAHAKEMGQTEKLSTPMIFLKAGSCAQIEPTEILLPDWSTEIHYETEMALLLDDILNPRAVAVALDLTERNCQSIAKAKGSPWTLAKSFTGSCPIGPFKTIDSLDEIQDIELSLIVNDEVKQKGRTSDMIFSVKEILDYLRQHFPVCPGDLVLTGTPEGVGPLKPGDHLQASLGTYSSLTCKVR